MQKILIAPGRYVQGAGACSQSGAQVAKLGKKALVIGGKRGLGAVEKTMKESFEASGVAFVKESFGGECCFKEIDRVASVAKDKGADFIVSVGGGKAHDTGKMAAFKLGIPVVVVPTIAATDAPCSALSVVYSEEGVFESYEFPPSPDMVIVDTEIVAKAPTRLLVSGMGDALATWFEAEACYKTRASNMPGGAATEAAMALARLCYDQLLEYGYEAKLACDADVVTPALERIVEANTLLSGMGFESGGLAAAHAIHNGMTAIEEMHQMYHGEKVAFGTLTQLVLQDSPKEIMEDVLDFCSSVGLPITLAQLGLKDPTPEKIMAAAEMATAEGETIHNQPCKVTASDVANAMMAADALGRSWLALDKS
ncbi:iron-containing alcohol dehydrogenase [Dethiosulfovibrio peptidovorans DSM 11002]|uniref:Glycerol dehydrogenase n=1 Tax=Dethiosulfovibrio peptidovorans DSM 11002 TaxID=469381 RepID=D2Z8I1_9BACT|nr:glycerol dehydrogenase [Dethiosulfovibrio peptidovorans]EFC91778.1 iron-containing alcohol dehydrogenase [Dethiosulfovibrio peptidovorans DSM 11002]